MRHVSTRKAEPTHIIELTDSECIMIATALTMACSHMYRPLSGHETIMGFNVKEYVDQFDSIRRS